MSALEAAPEGSATAGGAPGARDGTSSAAASTASSAASASGSGGAAVVVAAPPVVVVGPPPPAPAPASPPVSCPDVAAAAMSVLSAADAGNDQVAPGDPATTHSLSRRAASARTMDASRTVDPRLRPDPLWRRTVPRGIRDELIRLMQEELQRITGQEDRRHLRMCAARYESYAWRKSDNQIRYFQKMGRRIDSLRDQPSFRDAARSRHQESSSSSAPSSEDEHLQEEHASCHELLSPATVVSTQLPQRYQRRHDSPQHCFPGIMAMPSSSSSSPPPSSASSTSSSSSAVAASVHAGFATATRSLDGLSRDERYFRKLRIMKAKYRDEVALVFRELCRVNTVIQHSASLRRHESNNLGDFLANLKKIIYLLEQQPDEMNGMIPARKRTLEYLDVVESHIQRKVLPILYRLRHTYSTILRPIVLNYLKNSGRFSRR